MNRVKKVERLYLDAKPQIDRVRAIESHTRRVRKRAIATARADGALRAMVEELPNMNRDQVRELAKAMDIKGRGRMTKGGLIEALRKKLRR